MMGGTRSVARLQALGVILLLFAVGFGYQHAPALPVSSPPFRRPVGPADNGPRDLPALTVEADQFGQFYLPAKANGVPFQGLADTGATDVTIGRNDTHEFGIDISRLTFDGWSSTANGNARVATVRLARLSVGPFEVTDFPVRIVDGDLPFPLLGMGFLRRTNIAIHGGTLTLSSVVAP